MVNLATELPDESLSTSEIERLRERPAVRSVIELPTSYEHSHDVTSTATALVDGTVLYLTLDPDHEQWQQHVLARDANERELLEATLDQFEAG
ncbi:hypothetical protein [Halococcus thailandensis]|uniref:DUF7964 domain-containing protein n=1 Tax=Halococcus thailandensis JCM 13552 TaxID=1227457 RepID=M0NAP4_9EURY|nr:hypothetical protein [Halococcus thailandensis]EMA54169.1 hypothetical protein C451_07867 [Halococcus thailandensis JCM 13552]